MASTTLEALGFSDERAGQIVEKFRAHDEQTLERQYAIREDESALIASSKDAAKELMYLFETDREDEPK